MTKNRNTEPGMLTGRSIVSRAGAVALLATAALLTQISPASAHGSGTTTGGHSNIDKIAEPASPLCLKVDILDSPKTKITLFNTGTANDGQTVTFDAIFEATETFWFGPGGTYLNDQCSGDPQPVAGTLHTTGNLQCDSVNATYKRTGSTYTITTGTNTTNCKIGGVGHTSTLTFTGTQLACSFAADNCGTGTNSVEFTGTYSQG
ncbi:MAG TPA: hypothetical protein VM142_14030 [Acidimicrobiales bacterium]|nr:hypothetical protein [Acidimicrobiales bacterium]